MPTERSLRLCFVADAGSVHTIRWMRFFAERGHSVALVSPQEPPPGFQPSAFFPLSRSRRFPGGRFLKNVLELRRALRSFAPDVLHAHYINENGWLAACSGFHPFVLTAWGSDVYLAPLQSRLAAKLNPWAVRKADLVTADSADQVERLIRMGAAAPATEQVNWGVDLDRFRPGNAAAWRASAGISPQATIVLSPRQWIPNSNIPALIEAFDRVRRELPATVLVLKQSGPRGSPYQQQLEELLRVRGLVAASRLVGELAEHELPELYAAADITVSFTSSDGTPVSLLEAMASGSAVIAGDLPSVREWVRDGDTGLLVPVADVAALAAQIKRLISDPDLRRDLAERARRLVEQLADRNANLGRMEAIYRSFADASRAKTPRTSRLRATLRALYKAAPNMVLRVLGPLVGRPKLDDQAFIARLRRGYGDAVREFGRDHWERKLIEFGLAGDARVLDLGCGPGQWLGPLASHNQRVVGVDLDAELLDTARAATRTLPAIQLLRARAERLPFPDASFDAVLCYSVLMYTDHATALREIARVLKPGGKLVVGVVGAGYYLMHLAAGLRCRELQAVRYAVEPLLSRLGQILAPSLRAVTPWSGGRARRALEQAGFHVQRLVADRKDPEWPERYLGCRFYFCAQARKRS